jgi:triosephosphate isomerase
MQKIVIANWKMNFPHEVYHEIKNSNIDTANLIICPPQAYLSQISAEVGTHVKLASQNVTHLSEKNGAFTGEVSAVMLKNLACDFCLVGHSERRIFLNETNADIKQKISHLHQQNITAILCIGETLAEKNNGQSHLVLTKQLKECLPLSASNHNTIIAYEPVWSIGTSICASTTEISEAFDFISAILIKEFELNLDLVYGGSVSPSSFTEMISIEKLKGILVGSAGLKLDILKELLKIVENKL